MSRKYFRSILVFLITIVFIGIAASGYDQNNIASDTDNSEICPDSQAVIETAFLSSSLDRLGQPIDDIDIFSADTPIIYCSFVPPDLCCSWVSAEWFYEDEVIETWYEGGISSSFLKTISLNKPEGGFLKGTYHVKIYLGGIERYVVTFTVK